VINELKLKLDEQSQIKVELVRMNKFTPNDSFCQDSFGLLYLNEDSSNYLFESQILKDKQPSELLKVCGFSFKDKWILFYQGTQDVFGEYDFHLK